MITINKAKEPKSWMLHRLTPGAKYEPSPELRKALLNEQGYICAYCMRRIDDEASKTRIEHVIPQSKLSIADAMDYSNMVICCTGDISGCDGSVTHCDRHKENSLISFSPFDITTLGKNRAWKKSDIERILEKYSAVNEDGKFIPYCGVVIEYLTKKLKQY